MKPRKYTPSKRVRNHIAKWEASDFAGQNAAFGGDAVGAKAIELMDMLGDKANAFTDNELDGLLSTYYNLSPRGFRKTLMPYIDAYAADQSDINKKGLDLAMRDRWRIAAKKYQKGIRRRANADADLMGLSYQDPIIEQPDVIKRTNIVVPEENTEATWKGAENVSPYVTGKPIIKLQPRLKLPPIEELMEDSAWEPSFRLNPRGYEDGKRPITTGGAGYVPSNYGREVKDVFYNTVGPYSTYDFNSLFRNFGKRKDEDLRKALIEDANWHIRTISKDKGYEPEHAKRLISQYNRDINNANIADELLAQYLEIPIERRHTNNRLRKSKYRNNAYSIPIDSKQWEGIIDDTNDLNIGENKSSDILSMTGLATHAIGRGYDSKGEYRSIGDSYDLNPFRGNSAVVDIPLINKINDLSFGLGKPFDVYNRIYLDDYYGVQEPTHSTWLPEVTIWPRNK